MTLTTLNDNQPEWVKPELGLEEYKEFKLGQKVKFHKDWVYIIHIQKDKAEEVLFRGMLSNGASITMTYELINKPVETTNEQLNNKEKQLIKDLLTCRAVIFEHCDQKDQPIIESILNKLS